MDDHNILANCVRHEPWVWLRRLVIIEDSDPETRPIRDIAFSRGLNIVWAQEPEAEDANSEISGHSAGKTSLCRLIRYVFGEKQFATKNNTRLIGSAFPEGYVGAEIFVKGKQWAVIRPLKKGRTSYVKSNATVEEVLSDRSIAAFENDYPEKLGLTALLSDLASGTIIETGQQIKWDHVLAWCARDQEMRFQDVFGWRSPRSESDWPAFQQPKADALFLIRVVLGLFLPQELAKEEVLGEMKRERERLEKKVADLEKEPEFRVNLYDRELRNRLKAIFPDNVDIDGYPIKSPEPLSLYPDLERTTQKAVQQLEENIADIEKDRKEAQDSVDDLGGKIRDLEGKLNTLNAVIALDNKAQDEISIDPVEREKIRKQFDDLANSMCLYGDVLFSECSHIKSRREGLKKTEIQDAHAVEQNEAKRAASIAQLEKQRENLSGQIIAVKSGLEKARRTRDGLFASIREKRDDSRDLKLSIANLNLWVEKKSKPNEFKELDATRELLGKKEEEISKTEEELNVLLEKHNANRQKLASIFSTSVKRVLRSGTYDGSVSLTERQLAFAITHGVSMSGEAVETLAVLLTDLSSLIYNAQNEDSKLPGFLLHDSPREADLGKRIYWSFLSFAASLQKSCPSLDQCPFQYILTTTTEPPTDLQTPDWIKLRLDASKVTELLFRKNIAESKDSSEPELPAEKSQNE